MQKQLTSSLLLLYLCHSGSSLSVNSENIADLEIAPGQSRAADFDWHERDSWGVRRRFRPKALDEEERNQKFDRLLEREIAKEIDAAARRFMLQEQENKKFDRISALKTLEKLSTTTHIPATAKGHDKVTIAESLDAKPTIEKPSDQMPSPSFVTEDPAIDGKQTTKVDEPTKEHKIEQFGKEGKAPELKIEEEKNKDKVLVLEKVDEEKMEEMRRKMREFEEKLKLKEAEERRKTTTTTSTTSTAATTTTTTASSTTTTAAVRTTSATDSSNTSESVDEPVNDKMRFMSSEERMKYRQERRKRRRKLQKNQLDEVDKALLVNNGKFNATQWAQLVELRQQLQHQQLPTSPPTTSTTPATPATLPSLFGSMPTFAPPIGLPTLLPLTTPKPMDYHQFMESLKLGLQYYQTTTQWMKQFFQGGGIEGLGGLMGGGGGGGGDGLAGLMNGFMGAGGGGAAAG